MVTKNTYRILIWVIVVLLATNLSMGISFLFHKQQDKKIAAQIKEANIEVPAQQRARFFREQLKLSQNQIESFRDLNRDYNWKARQITMELQSLRIEMINLLGEKDPDKIALDSISKTIGDFHSKLKRETIEYYLEMKKICNEDQQEKLNAIFRSMLKTKENVSIPQQRGKRNRGIK